MTYPAPIAEACSRSHRPTRPISGLGGRRPKRSTRAERSAAGLSSGRKIGPCGRKESRHLTRVRRVFTAAMQVNMSKTLVMSPSTRQLARSTQGLVPRPCTPWFARQHAEPGAIMHTDPGLTRHPRLACAGRRRRAHATALELSKAQLGARLARLRQGSRTVHRPQDAADPALFTPPVSTALGQLGAGAGAAAGQQISRAGCGTHSLPTPPTHARRVPPEPYCHIVL